MTTHLCKALSTHSHRFCQSLDCECQCHNIYNAKNYTKNSLRKVKRIG